MPADLRIRTLSVMLSLAACGGRAGRGGGPVVDSTGRSAEATFVCADSLRRSDGTQASTTCLLAREYCYEASGGAAFSHGAHCRPLPRANATCADVASGAGSSCTGTNETGLFATLAYP
jgi:hypothetical protein